MKTLIIIPAYNEEASIAGVIDKVKNNMPKADIIVINDGSTDRTSYRAKKAGVNVVDLPFNLGIGGAVQVGYIYANRQDYDVAVQVDGDGQHDPSYIPKLIESISNDLCDMAIGSRYVHKSAYKSSISRRTGMLFFSVLVGFLTGRSIKDTTSGFRAVNKKVIHYFADQYPPDYPEVDVLVKLHKNGFRIAELPVEMQERESGKSSITPSRSLYYMIKVSLSLLIGSMRSSDARIR